MNLAGHSVNAFKLRLEDVVQVLSNCLEGIGHDGVRLGQDLLGDAAASFGTGLLRLHGSTLVSKDAVRLQPDGDGDSADLRDLSDCVRGLDGLPGLELLPEGVSDLEHNLVTVASCGRLHSVARAPE